MSRTDKQKSIQVLLDAGASISHRDDFGRTPAYFALGNKNTMALTALQKKGADFSEGEYPNTWTIETYLNQALFQESWSIVDFLLKLGHDPNRHSGPYAHTPLQVALQIVNTVKLEAFVAEHAPEYDENFERYGTLLAAACSQSNPALVRMLLEKAKGNGRDMVEYVNAGCYVYATPLYSAAFRGNMELLLMLIEEGADVRSKEGGWLGTPLDAACAMERVDVVRVLWERGACLRKSKMEGPWMAEGCKGSVKMEAIRGILNGRDPYTPGPEMESRAGIIMAGRPLKDEIGGKLVSRQTF
ncbi:ankyrin [Cadophora sp. DSE1049]|nr:ankyrin [Cadophora sp. DSE1049]